MYNVHGKMACCVTMVRVCGVISCVTITINMPTRSAHTCVAFIWIFVKYFEEKKQQTHTHTHSDANKERHSFGLQQCVPNEQTHYNFSFRWIAYDIGIIRKRYIDIDMQSGPIQ